MDYSLHLRHGKAPFHIYAGCPRKTAHPLRNQADWLLRERGGIISPVVMESFEQLHEIAKSSNLNFEELCAYTLADSKYGSTPATAVDGTALLKEKVLDLSKIKSLLGKKINKAVSKKERQLFHPYITDIAWPIFKKDKYTPHDNLLQSSFEKTAVYVMEVAREIWLGTDEISFCSRSLFLALALYLGVKPDANVTLSEIFDTITVSDVDYRLCLVVDAFGACLPFLSYNLIRQWLYYPKDSRDRIVLHMASAMVEFSLSSANKARPYQTLRRGLKKHLLTTDSKVLSHQF